MGVTRRWVLGTGAAGAGALGFSAWACARGRALAWAPERLRIARATLPDPAALARAFHGERVLPAAVGEKPGLVAAMATSCPATRATLIATQIRADYAAGDVLVCGRWVVARSEALIAAVT